MAPQNARRGNSNSADDDFDGRDLLVGRPEGAEGRPAAGAAKSPTAANSPQPPAHDAAIAEILATVRTTAARIDTLQDTLGPGHETAEALARETAALTQAVLTRAARSPRQRNWPSAGTGLRRRRAC